MKFSLILPTLGQRIDEIERLFKSLELQTYKNFEVIIVSQDNHDDIDNIINKYNFEHIHIKINQKGISVARNIGLKHVKGDVIHLTDDDCWFHEKSLEMVKNYIIDKNCDIATFKSFDPIQKKYPKKFYDNYINNLSKRQLLKQISFNIFVNLNKVQLKDLKFDERFGVGKKYNSGEENIFLMDLYNKGYRNIMYMPEIITYHPVKDNLYLEGMSFVAKGPLFKRLFGSVKGFPIFILFSLKKMSKISKFNYWFRKAIIEYFKFKI